MRTLSYLTTILRFALKLAHAHFHMHAFEQLHSKHSWDLIVLLSLKMHTSEAATSSSSLKGHLNLSTELTQCHYTVLEKKMLETKANLLFCFVVSESHNVNHAQTVVMYCTASLGNHSCM